MSTTQRPRHRRWSCCVLQWRPLAGTPQGAHAVVLPELGTSMRRCLRKHGHSWSLWLWRRLRWQSPEGRESGVWMVTGPSCERCDVLADSFERVLRSRGGGATFRLLDLGSGSGGWLLQARKELQAKKRRQSLTVHIQGVTGDALPTDVGLMTSSKTKRREFVEVEHFQQVGIETFPLLLSGDTQKGAKEQREDFKGMLQTMMAPGREAKGEARWHAGRGYDLILSSWTFCHLIDPLATLELWSNTLTVEGELYVNDIDFSVMFDEEQPTGVPERRDERELKRETGPVDDDCPNVWERSPEKRMERAFAALSRKGEADNAFTIEFVYDDETYRTAVKVRRISTSPIRFMPVVGYSYCDEEDDESPPVDGFGRPVYRLFDDLD
eukprot:TRINITY_DN30148_c0_g1_i2.p1 TRINITY_DN30148_c0_g1~~TRINITY_DN30148_c0_g1_i2.p1  ORF type:complete len:382 (+),score=43.87 TRINITY_DN30148_c0_g1_i2:189-1334(+)